MSKSFLRNIIGEYMVSLGEKDNRVVLINADLAGTCRNRSFIELFPNRSFNTGIAEQNMISFAAGLAFEGFIPYTFSMAPFLTMRACEQVRTDIAYGDKNVRMIGIYAGVSGGISGATHWAIEDFGIINSIPNITIFEVSDANQAKKILDFSLIHKGPIYIRCGVEPTEDIYDENIKIVRGGSITANHGDDGAFLCTGVIVQSAINAAKRIKEKFNKSIRVIDLYSMKPIDKNAILNAALTGNVIVAQDHNIMGGIGSVVSTCIVEAGVQTKIKILGIPDEFVPMAHAPFLYKKFGLDSDGLFSSMIELLGK